MNSTQNYEIKGAHCGACIEMIKRSLAKLPGIEAMDADFDKKRITLTVTEQYNEESAFKSVAQLGYQLQKS